LAVVPAPGGEHQQPEQRSQQVHLGRKNCLHDLSFSPSFLFLCFFVATATPARASPGSG
jgi:hypothetical protein